MFYQHFHKKIVTLAKFESNLPVYDMDRFNDSK